MTTIAPATAPAGLWLRCSHCRGITATAHAIAAGRADQCQVCGWPGAAPIPAGIDPRTPTERKEVLP